LQSLADTRNLEQVSE